MADPFGYNTYRQLMKLRGGAIEGIESYKVDPLKSFAIALGLKKGPIARSFEKTGQEIRKARRGLK